jgi:glycosyltransferase involved in cell wall biosynthesis
MRILYFSFVELDIPNACQTHTLGVLRGLSHNGCFIDALVPRPLKMRPVIPAARFYYLWPWRFSRLGRMWIKLLSAFFMIFLCIRNRYDAIYVREMEANPVPRLTSKLFKVPLYIEINDLIVPTLSDSGISSYLLRKVRKCQELDFEQSAGLIIPSVPRRNWIIKQYNIPEAKVHLILNGTDDCKAKQLDQRRAKNRLGLSPNSFCLGFVGTIYERYDFNLFLQVILACQDLISELFFIVIGDGPLRSKIEKKVSEIGLERNMIFTGYIDSEKLGNVIPALDIGLLILTKKHAVSAGPVHTKLATYAMFNLPIVTTGFSLKGYPEDLCQGLYLVPPENRSAMADKILHIYNNPKESSEKAKILNNYALNNLSWNAVTIEIIEIMKNNIKLQQDYL